ncbi:hypothetical protein L873DRAFT_1650031, partial [Choiromyces venosus 120613-1]
FLPPAVRFAKIVGTVGSGALAGFYYTHSQHTVPSLLASDAPAGKLVKAFKHIHHASHTPALATIIVSSSSFAYVAYYLFYYPPTQAGVATTTFTSSSFFPSTSVDYPLGDEWALYGASALLVALVVPYTKILMTTVQKSLLGAAESVERTERRKLGVSVVEEKKVKEDFEEWKWRSMIRVGLTSAA